MIAYTRDQRAGQSRDHTREQSGLRTALAIISGDKPCSHYPEPQQEAGTCRSAAVCLPEQRRRVRISTVALNPQPQAIERASGCDGGENGTWASGYRKKNFDALRSELDTLREDFGSFVSTLKDNGSGRAELDGIRERIATLSNDLQTSGQQQLRKLEDQVEGAAVYESCPRIRDRAHHRSGVRSALMRPVGRPSDCRLSAGYLRDDRPRARSPPPPWGHLVFARPRLTFSPPLMKHSTHSEGTMTSPEKILQILCPAPTTQMQGTSRQTPERVAPGYAGRENT